MTGDDSSAVDSGFGPSEGSLQSRPGEESLYSRGGRVLQGAAAGQGRVFSPQRGR